MLHSRISRNLNPIDNMTPKVHQFYSKIENLKDKILIRQFIEDINISEKNSFSPPFQKVKFNDFLGKNTIITGESEKGKTYLTACFLNFLLKNVVHSLDSTKIFVIDMAPRRFLKNSRSIGGKIVESLSSIPISQNLIYLDIQNIIPPRSNSKTAKEAIQFAKTNYKYILPQVNRVIHELKKQRKTVNKKPIQNIIIINDLSLYLHYGSPKLILTLMKMKSLSIDITLFMNSYEGMVLLEDHGSGITEKEKKKVALIKNKCDVSIQMI